MRARHPSFSLLLVSLLVSLHFSIGCGSAPPPKSSTDNFDRSAPHWEDAFDRVPDLLVIVRPQALRRDPIYGPLLKLVSRLAAAKSPAGTGERAALALESADEVLLGVRDRSKDDVLVVARGIRPDFDPEKLTDERGVPLWRARGPETSDRARVTELVRANDTAASLFVLPQRTWVVAVGDARPRARDAFANPFGRPSPAKDDRALILLRLDGPGLVQSVPRLRTRGGLLEPIGRQLSWVSFALYPGKEGLLVTLTYAEEGAAAWAESTLGQVVEAYGHGTNPRTAWIGGAKVDRQGRSITLRVALPPRLLEELPAVDATDIGL